MDYIKIGLLGLIALVSAMAANFGQDLAYQVHALLIMVISFGMMIWVLRGTDEPKKPAQDISGYADGVVRAGVIATTFWGIVGFLAGTFIAFQLAFPELNFDWGQPYTNFGRLRPLHTSAVIFAFGGNALIMSSFYIVQRTCGTRLWGGNLAWFVFWGYQLFIVLAASGYLLGSTQSKEYAEPEWYVDIWLTIVWVAYFAVFFGTIVRRKERHIYVANWFFLAFIVTIAMLHIINNLSIPVSIWGSKSVQVFSGVQDAMVQFLLQSGRIGRNGDHAGIQTPEERGDVFQAGRIDQEGPLARFDRGLERGRDGPCLAVQFTGGQGLFVGFTVDEEGIKDFVRLIRGAEPEQFQKSGEFGPGHVEGLRFPGR